MNEESECPGRKRFECSVARNYLRVCGCRYECVCLRGARGGWKANLVIIWGKEQRREMKKSGG